ncbi:hypothetical protein D3C87_1832760 [compost metagenome]
MSALAISPMIVFLRARARSGLRVGEYLLIPFRIPIKVADCETVSLSGVVLKYTLAADLIP